MVSNVEGFYGVVALHITKKDKPGNKNGALCRYDIILNLAYTKISIIITSKFSISLNT